MQKPRILIVDGNLGFARSLLQCLAQHNYEVTTVAKGERAIEVASEREFDLALVGLEVPGRNGESVLHALKKAHPQLEVVVLTGHGSVDSAVRCMRLGCFTYLEKSCGLEVLLETLEQALRSHTERMRKPEKAKVNAIASVAVHGSAEEILR